MSANQSTKTGPGDCGEACQVQINHAKDIASAAVELARHEATMPVDEPNAALVKNVATVLSMRKGCIVSLPGQSAPRVFRARQSPGLQVGHRQRCSEGLRQLGMSADVSRHLRASSSAAASLRRPRYRRRRRLPRPGVRGNSKVRRHTHATIHSRLQDSASCRLEYCGAIDGNVHCVPSTR